MTDCWTRLTRSLPVLGRYTKPWIMTLQLPTIDSRFALTFERGRAQLRLFIAVDAAGRTNADGTALMHSSYDFFVDQEHRAEAQGSLLDAAYMNELLALLDAHFVAEPFPGEGAGDSEDRGG